MLCKKVELSDFLTAFERYKNGRIFSVSARIELFKWYDSQPDLTVLDLSDIDSDWQEYAEIGDALIDYEYEDEDELRDDHNIIEFKSGVLVQGF